MRRFSGNEHEFFSIQVAEKILNKMELEFYKWDGDISQLLQNVRDKLNRVADVISFTLSQKFTITLHSYVGVMSKLIMNGILINFQCCFTQNWSRDEKNHCLEETEKSFKFSGDILRLILS